MPRMGMYGLVLLAYQLGSLWSSYGPLPPLTLGLVAVQTMLFTKAFLPSHFLSVASGACLRASNVFNARSHFLRDIYLAQLMHASDLHLYYNMVSLMYKGRQLEGRHFGTLHFSFVVVFLAGATGFLYAGLAGLAARLLDSPAYLDQCAVGFSGVLFALKVLVHHYDYDAEDTTRRFGFSLPIKLAVWTELLAIQLLAPNASFLGHLAGILAGLLYVHGCRSLRAVWASFSAAWQFLFASHPATLMAAALLAAVQFNLVDKPWPTRHFWSSHASLVCLHGATVWDQGDYWRLVSAPLEHASPIHFAICLVSFVLKSSFFERHLGARQALKFSVLGVLLTSLVYAAASVSTVFNVPMECALGLSGPLFALKAVYLFEADSLLSPTSLFEVFEMLILLERRTLPWHVAGLAVGLAWAVLRRKGRFPGPGRRLVEERERPPTPANPQPRWTRSWGYGGPEWRDYQPQVRRAGLNRSANSAASSDHNSASRSRVPLSSASSRRRFVSRTTEEDRIYQRATDEEPDEALSSSSWSSSSSFDEHERDHRSGSPSPESSVFRETPPPPPPPRSVPEEGNIPPPPSGGGTVLPRESPTPEYVRLRRLQRFT